MTYLFPCYAYNSLQLLKSILLLTNHSLPGSNGITCAIPSMSPILITCIPYPSSLFSTATIRCSRHGLADPGSLSSITNAKSCILPIYPRTLDRPSSLATIRLSSSPILPLSSRVRSRRRTHTQPALSIPLCRLPHFPVHGTSCTILLSPCNCVTGTAPML